LPELLIELFSEEIPARMQARAWSDLRRLLDEALQPLSPRRVMIEGKEASSLFGPRRIAYAAEVDAQVPDRSAVERGPRVSAPEQALAGFLRKHNADKAMLRQDGEFWVLDRTVKGTDAASLVAAELPKVLRAFPWPKSMRWGGTSRFTWVRPLRRILCILDGTVVPFNLSDGTDDGHGLASSNLTEGHRFMSPGAFAVASVADWKAKLLAAHVIADAADRQQRIGEQLASATATRGLEVVPDPGLLDEVSGLVEWPVTLIGAIDPAHMDLPAEVMQVSMRVNQRYFALRDSFGPAPCFAFVANIAAPDGGAAIIAGNERVLRARFSDARHFWDLDRNARLESRVAALDGITFHAKLGTQGARVARLVKLAEALAPLVGADPGLARRAALLAKADLTTGMVGEFPELQGVMGGYYATHDDEPPAVAAAVRDHYLPKGPGDGLPTNPVGVAVALADKLDQIVSFFAVGEKPTGSGDPFALRRAALGVIRIVREGTHRIALLAAAFAAAGDANAAVAGEVLDFLIDRLRVQLRAEGARHDVLNAVLGAGADDDIVRILARTAAVGAFLGTEAGENLLAAYRRAANILRIESKKDGREPHDAIDSALLEEDAERDLARAIGEVGPAVAAAVAHEKFTDAMASLAGLRAPVDRFFEAILVNAERPELRQNRLRLLFHLRAAMNMAADFSRIEG
jgi:glycyl-tRNA synthetase beta chain